MSLGTALQIAQNSLASVSRRTDVVARNVANANDANYVRREAIVVPRGPGGGVTSVSRAALDAGLVRAGLDATSEAGARTTIAETLDTLSIMAFGPNGERAPAAALSRLHDALQTWSASPADPLLADVAGGAARDVERAFSDTHAAIERGALEIEGRIGADVERLNRSLEQFGTANDAIVRAVRTGQPAPLDALDRRDEALRSIAEIVPVSTIERRDGDLMVTTRRGATLFETVPRSVTFEPGEVSRIAIDGVAVPALTDAEEPRGRLEAHLHLRNEVVGDLHARNDAAARGAVEAFGPSGLFVSPGGVPTAATIEVPAGYDMATLRTGAPSFADAIIAAAEALDTPRVMAAGTEIERMSGLLAFSSDGIAALDQRLSEATNASARSRSIAEVMEEKRVATGGVDIDAEMTRLLALERSYEASARIVSVADRMLAELLAAVR